MVWFKVDDHFWASDKLQGIPARHRIPAAGLWVIAGSWASGQLTNGRIPEYMLKVWGATPATVAALVNAGLWEHESGAYVFRSWLKYQPSKTDVEDEREASKQRMRNLRAKRKGLEPQKDAENEGMFGRTLPNGSESVRQPDPTRPDPTRPTNTSPKGEVARKRATRIPEPFIVTPDMRKWASGEVPGVDVDHATRMFVDYWRAESGQKATKRDWVATWRNWLRRDQPRHQQRPSRTSNELEAFALLGGDKHDRAGSPRALDPGEQG